MSFSSPTSLFNVDVRPEKPPRLRVDATGHAPRGARALVSLIAFIAALLGPGNWACRGQTPTVRSARPLRFTPGSGPIEGDRLVFIDVEEPAAAIGTASIACRFGQHAASPGKYDATSARYLCRTPAHSRPDSGTLPITMTRDQLRMPA